jgi:hypothetical protein
VNTIARIRMLRNVANRPDLREGTVCEVPAADSDALLAASLAEPVADADPQGAQCAPPTADPPAKRGRKPKQQPAP